MASFGWADEVIASEMPAPKRVAPYSLAYEADVLAYGEAVGTGRLIILHNPLGNESWDGTTRIVTYSTAKVDMEMVTDPMLSEVGWSWLTESLESHQVGYHCESGTVTTMSSRSFGALDGTDDKAEIEIRASWTPHLSEPNQIQDHLAAWQDLLCLTASVEQLPTGVVSLAPRIKRVVP